MHRAEAWRESDKQMIHAAVEATIGFSNLNALLIKHLRNWLVGESTAALARYPAGSSASAASAASALASPATAAHAELSVVSPSPLTPARGSSGEQTPSPGGTDMLSMNERSAGFRAAAAANAAAAAASANASASADVDVDTAIAIASPTARAAGLRGSFAGVELQIPPASNRASLQSTGEQQRSLAGITQRWFSGTVTAPAVGEKLPEAGEPRYERGDACFGELMSRHVSPLCTSVCKLLIELGRYDEAAPLAELSLLAHTQLSGGTHAGTMGAAHTLGVLRMKQGQLEHARQILGDVVAARRDVLGEEHEDTLDSVESLALVLQSLKLPAKAEPLFRLALTGWRARQASVLHSEASYVRAASFTVAPVDSVTAPIYMREPASPRRRRASQRPHLENIDGNPPIYMRETLAAINNLASLLRAMGGDAAKGSELSESHLEEAETLLRESLAGKQQLLGTRHPETLIGVNQLGLLLQVHRLAAKSLLALGHGCAPGGNACRQGLGPLVRTPEASCSPLDGPVASEARLRPRQR